MRSISKIRFVKINRHHHDQLASGNNAITADNGSLSEILIPVGLSQPGQISDQTLASSLKVSMWLAAANLARGSFVCVNLVIIAARQPINRINDLAATNKCSSSDL